MNDKDLLKLINYVNGGKKTLYSRGGALRDVLSKVFFIEYFCVRIEEMLDFLQG